MGLLLESSTTETLLAIVGVCWVLYSKVTKEYSHWKERGVPQVEPVFPFGSLKDVFLGRKNFGQVYQEFYTRFKGERFFGIYETYRSILVLRDPNLIEHVLNKDFQHFSNRVVLPMDKKDICNNIFFMSGQDWVRMRSKLTPAFTDENIKPMFSLMQKTSQQLKGHLERLLEDRPEVDIKDAFARFTMDTIASCVFGKEINCQSDRNCEFYRYGIKVFKLSIKKVIERLFFTVFPFMNKLYTQRYSSAAVTDYFTKTVRDAVEYREKNSFNRNDFLELMIKIRRNKSLLEGGDRKNRNNDEELKKSVDKSGITIEEIAAQSFLFFFAGYDSSSATTVFCLYELACNPEIQGRLYKEIKEVLKKHGGEVTYEALQEMSYMDLVINETLRRYASLAVLNRMCSQTYKLPKSHLVLEKGQKVAIPVYAIHHDPEYYPDPYKFNPERFTPEGKKKRHPYVHLPFGEGPRSCIGMKFGLLQVKLGLTEMISRYEFGVTPQTQIPLTIHKISFFTQPEKPVILRLTKRVES